MADPEEADIPQPEAAATLVVIEELGGSSLCWKDEEGGIQLVERWRQGPPGAGHCEVPRPQPIGPGLVAGFVMGGVARQDCSSHRRAAVQNIQSTSFSGARAIASTFSGKPVWVAGPVTQ